MAKRLTRDDWLAQGLQVLKTEGHLGLRAEKMVKSLGVSRGSFYWHFADIEAFHDAVLKRWRAEMIRKHLFAYENFHDSALSGVEQIWRMFDGDTNLELAIRQWRSTNKASDLVIGEVDRHRLRLMVQIFMENGIGLEQADKRAKYVLIFYAGMIAEVGFDKTALREIMEMLLQPANL